MQRVDSTILVVAYHTMEFAFLGEKRQESRSQRFGALLFLCLLRTVRYAYTPGTIEVIPGQTA